MVLSRFELLRSMVIGCTALLVGCFGGKTPPSTVDSKVHQDWTLLDLGRPDQAAPDLGCASVPLVLEAEADACLVSGAANAISYGKASICNIGSGGDSSGIFRFDISQVPLSARLLSLTLSLAYGERDDACKSSCGSCDSLEHDGLLQLYYMRSDWPEEHVTWRYRAYKHPTSGTLDWDQPGARGPKDVSGLITTVAHGAKQGVVFTSNGSPALLAELGRWRTADHRITYQVLPSNSVAFIAAMKDQPGTGCPAVGYARPTLRLSYCP